MPWQIWPTANEPATPLLETERLIDPLLLPPARRQFRASSIPIVSGVGHEIDFTIADFAADMRAPTPSAAAELVVPDAAEWLGTLARLGARLERSVRRRLDERRQRLRWLDRRAALVSPMARFAQRAQRLDELDQRMTRAVRRRLQGWRERLRWLRGRAALASPAARLARRTLEIEDLRQRLVRALRLMLAAQRERLLPLARTLHAVSPLATLDRGYAIVKNERGEILRDAADAPAQTFIEARLAKGSIRAKVQGS